VPSLPVDATIDGLPLPGTFSTSLTSAGYDPTTQTCSSVACHLQQVSVRWGDKAFETPKVGGGFQNASCGLCHPQK
jgi:predicted CxxxxCH...CXXCH cytochrome family protein